MPKIPTKREEKSLKALAKIVKEMNASGNHGLIKKVGIHFKNDAHASETMDTSIAKIIHAKLSAELGNQNMRIGNVQQMEQMNVHACRKLKRVKNEETGEWELVCVDNL